MLKLEDFKDYQIDSSNFFRGGWEATGNGTHHVLMQSFDYASDRAWMDSNGSFHTQFCCISNSTINDLPGACPC